MTNKIIELQEERYILRLEVQKLKLETQLAEFVAANLKKEFIKIQEIDKLYKTTEQLKATRSAHKKGGDRIEAENEVFEHVYHSYEAELSAHKKDSKVLMKVVEIVKDWDDSTGRAFPTLIKILDELVDYTDVPEEPPKTPDDENKSAAGFIFLESP